MKADPALEITIDVERRTIDAPAVGIDADVPARRRPPSERFLEGLDDIGITLRHADEIDGFESSRPAWLPSAPA